MRTRKKWKSLIAAGLALVLMAEGSLHGLAKATPTDAPAATATVTDATEEAGEHPQEKTATSGGASSPAEATENTEDAKASPTESYIRENANPDYTGSSVFEPLDVLHVKHTMLDGALVPGDIDIDTYWTTRQEDGSLTYIRAFLVQHETDVLLYNLEDESPYLVGFANTMLRDPGISTTDADFAANDNWGTALSDCIYESSTGLVYVPKAYLAGGVREEGVTEKALCSVQLQLLHLLIPTQVETSVRLVTEEGESEDIREELVGLNAEDFSTSLILPKEGEAREALSSGQAVVCVNDVPLTEDSYSYNHNTGILTVEEAPCSIDSVTVHTEESEFAAEEKRVDAAEDLKDPAVWETFQTWDVDGEPTVGDFFDFGNTSIIYDLSSDGSHTTGNTFYYGYYSYASLGDAANGSTAGGWDCPLASYVMSNSSNIIADKIANGDSWLRATGQNSAFGFYFGPDVPNVQDGISSVAYGPKTAGCSLSVTYNTRIDQHYRV